MIATLFTVLLMFVMPALLGYIVGRRHRGDSNWERLAKQQATLIDDALQACASKAADGDRTAVDLLLLLIKRPYTQRPVDTGIPDEWEQKIDAKKQRGF